VFIITITIQCHSGIGPAAAMVLGKGTRQLEQQANTRS